MYLPKQNEAIKLSKAESYSLYKNSTKLEKYSNLTKNQKHRKAISRFRLSCHPLMIEKGRHQNPSLIRSESICPHCANLVEDECHFLTTCTLNKIERSRLYGVYTNTSKNFLTMTNTQKFTQSRKLYFLSLWQNGNNICKDEATGGWGGGGTGGIPPQRRYFAPNCPPPQKKYGNRNQESYHLSE